MNLADIDRTEIERGSVVTRPGQLRSSRLLTCRVEATDGAELEDEQRLHFHLHSGSTTARLRIPGDSRRIDASRPAWAQLHLDEEIVAVAGDRFVLRSWSPMRTIGGGVVVDPGLRALSRKTRTSWLDPLTDASLEERLVWLARDAGPAGVATSDLVWRTGLESEWISKHLASTPAEVIEASTGLWFHSEVIRKSRKKAIELLSDWFDRNPLSTGMPRGEFLHKLLSDTHPTIIEAVLADLELERIAVASGKVIDVPGRDARPAGEMGALAGRVEEVYREAGLHPPSIRDIADELSQKNDVIRGIVGYLTETDALVRIGEGLHIHAETMDRVYQTVREMSGRTIDVAWIKETFGLTRKIAIPLLEHLDDAGKTIRSGDLRQVV